MYEFFACHLYGHTYRPFRELRTSGVDTLVERYESIMNRIEQVVGARYKVTILWECEFDEAKIVDDKQEFLTHPIVQHSPMKTRHALYGGRTEAMRLHYEIGENETIEYCNVVSLYPYICEYFKFPIDHPIVHVGDTWKDVEACLKMEGLIRCMVVPPKSLYHPVLLYRCNKKLLFCLCRSFVHVQDMREECPHHTDVERTLEGMWVIDDVRLAVQKGYKLLEIHEIYEYRVTEYNR